MVPPAQRVEAAKKANLDLIAVTDHDTMASVEETQKRGEENGLTVIAGQEITTRWPAQTHIMAWFLTHPISRGMSIEDTVKAIPAQHALAIIPHPFMPTYFASIQPDMLRRLIQTQQLDGIELVFTAPTGASRRKQLQDFYKENNERLAPARRGRHRPLRHQDSRQPVTHIHTDFTTAPKKKTTKPTHTNNKTTP